jgi:hypothetical protein
VSQNPKPLPPRVKKCQASQRKIGEKILQSQRNQALSHQELVLKSNVVDVKGMVTTPEHAL